MPYTLLPITLTENQTSLVTLPGTLGSVSYLKLVNASPYLLAINNLPDGSDYMQPGEANVWPVPGLSTAVQVTPQQFVSPVQTPSSVLVVTWYLEGEQPTGNYPVNFNLLTFNGGNIGVANQLVNDGAPSGTNVVEVTPAGGSSSTVLIKNDGSALFGQNVTIDGQINIGVPVAGSQSGILYESANFVLSLTPPIGGISPTGVAFTAWTGSALVSLFSLGQQYKNALTWIDQLGVLHAIAPVTLAAGNQESGMCGIQFVATGGGQTFGVGVNFKTVMTNVPSSISFAVITSANENAVVASHITQYGFFLGVTSTAAGAGFYVATYTTVGN